MPHTHTDIHIHQMQIKSAISFQHRIKSHMLTEWLFLILFVYQLEWVLVVYVLFFLFSLVVRF